MTIVMGVIAQAFISNRLVTFADANVTANNILSHPLLFQMGLTFYLIEMACQVAATPLFYRLLKPAGADIALVSAFLDLAGSVIKTFSRVLYAAPLFILSGSPSLSAFTPEQLRALSLVLLRINARGAGVALAFLGVSAVLNGYLIFRSGFLPRWLGVLCLVGSVGWLTFFYPPLGHSLFNYIIPVALLGAVALIFWLIVFGVDEERWRAEANRSRTELPGDRMPHTPAPAPPTR